MSNTDSTSVIDLPRVGCLLPTLIVEMVEQRGKCEDCSVKLSGDDEGDKCQDCQEQYDLLICGCCNQRVKQDGCGDMVNRGCCSNGDCNQEPPIESMCGQCGTWDEEEQVWRCPDCQEQYDLLICGCCDQRVEEDGSGNMVNQGCCSDGRCEHEPKIEVLCGECGTWDEEDEVWRCPDCQEEHEEETDDGFEDCECGYTHHYEDKCPNETTAKHYKKNEERLSSVKIDLEMLIEHLKKLQKEDPEEYDRLNLIFHAYNASF